MSINENQWESMKSQFCIICTVGHQLNKWAVFHTVAMWHHKISNYHLISGPVVPFYFIRVAGLHFVSPHWTPFNCNWYTREQWMSHSQNDQHFSQNLWGCGNLRLWSIPCNQTWQWNNPCWNDVPSETCPGKNYKKEFRIRTAGQLSETLLAQKPLIW